MRDIEGSITRLEDEADIRGATARFADMLMRADFDGFHTLWADDAEWVIGATEGQPLVQRAKGIDEIVAMFRNLWKGNDSFVHFAVQGVIELNGDYATSQCVCHESARGPAGRYYRTHGVWSDRLRRSDDGWIFTSREYRYLWLDLSPFTGDIFSIHPGQ